MNLNKKKELAARTFRVGKERIVFIESRMNEIKEAITRQDIKDLANEGAIILKNKKGTKIKEKGRKNRSVGNVRKSINDRKRRYMILTRKLRNYIKELKKNGKISRENYLDIRKKIRNRFFRDKNNLKEYLSEVKKE
ncbi:hypothetical protein HY448_00700 [Candidatus Pacearchaeota archaeon]|nr:hypothetical protein [Candidatus Pacearchaeota archaeon]